MGYSVEILEEGEGLSRYGSAEDQLYSGDVLRKLLGKLEKQSKVMAEDRVSAIQGGPAVKVRERISRRAVKDTDLDEAKAGARSAAVARQLLRWYNTKVGPGLLEYGQTGEGRRIHILDATKIEVAVKAGNYECSGVVKEDDGQFKRGYKLGTLRTLLDTAGIITQATVGQIQTHDSKLYGPLVRESTVLREGDLLLEDRGFLDGATLTHLKRQQGVDVIVPLRRDMLSYEEAVKLSR